MKNLSIRGMVILCLCVPLVGNSQISKNDTNLDNQSNDQTTILLAPTQNAVISPAFETNANVTSNSPGDMTVDDLVFGSSSLNDVTGTTDNSRLFFDKSTSAFRAGFVTGNQWNDLNLGLKSAAFGYNTKAKGHFSFAAGQNSQAIGNRSTAFGLVSKAKGISSFAYGAYAEANGSYSTAGGLNTSANGVASTSIGEGTITNSYGQISLGLFNNNRPGNTSSFNLRDRLFVIGNGTADDYPYRSDAMVVLKNGNTAIGNIEPTERLDVDGKVKIRDIPFNKELSMVLVVGLDGIISYRDDVIKPLTLAKEEEEIDYLQNQINEKNQRINLLETQMNEKEVRLSRIEDQLSLLLGSQSEQSEVLNDIGRAAINQNSPNPFNEDTSINYFIPESSKSAQIRFYDVTGQLIKTTDIHEKGQGILRIKEGTLNAGTYTYEFIVDNMRIDTKKMILAK